jgi:RNA polymerase sigma factor (TIGR02999 family)
MNTSLSTLISGWQSGCQTSTNKLKAHIYYHLKEVCSSHLSECKKDIDSTYVLKNLPNTISLLHQSLIDLVPPNQSLKQQTQFNTYLSIFIRNILHDEIRRAKAQKRTPNNAIETINNNDEKYHDDFIALNSAINHLEKSHPKKAKIFSLHYFLGLEPQVLATQFEISLSSIYRELDSAKAFLRLHIEQ